MSELQLKRDSFITILSTRKSGKSFLIRELIYYFLTNAEYKCDYLYMFSNTAKFDSTAYGYRGLMSGLFEATIDSMIISSGRFDDGITNAQVRFY